MKKTIALILALILSLALCACGSTTDTSSESMPTEETEATVELNPDVVGTWEYSYKYPETTMTGNAGDDFTKTIRLRKNGTGLIYWYNETQEIDSSSFALTWEYVDGVVNIYYSTSIREYIESFVYDSEAETLTSTDGTEVYY